MNRTVSSIQSFSIPPLSPLELSSKEQQKLFMEHQELNWDWETIIKKPIPLLYKTYTSINLMTPRSQETY